MKTTLAALALSAWLLAVPASAQDGAVRVDAAQDDGAQDDAEVDGAAVDDAAPDAVAVREDILALWPHEPIVEGQRLPTIQLPALDGQWYRLPVKDQRTLLIQFASW